MAARQGQGLPGAHQAQGGWRHGAGGGADASAMCPAPSVAAEDPARLCPGAQASAAVPPTQHTHAHAHATHGRTVTAVLLSSPRPGWSPRGPRPVAACSSRGPPLQRVPGPAGRGGRSTESPSHGRLPRPTPSPPRTPPPRLCQPLSVRRVALACTTVIGERGVPPAPLLACLMALKVLRGPPRAASFL